MVRLVHRSHTDDVRRAVPRLTAARLTGNTLYRAAPPFLPQIAASLGVTIGTMGLALGVGELVGLAAPFVGRRIDHSDRRRAIITALVLLAVAAALAGSSPVVAMFAAASALLSLAKIVFDGGMGAWIADRVQYRWRAQVVGLTETAWAGAMLIGIPTMAVVAAASSWRVSYALVGAANLVAAVVVWRGVAADPPPDDAVARSRWGDLRPGLPTFLAVGLLMAAGQMVFVVFGAWLQDAFGFGPLAVGGVAFLLGVGELFSSTSTMRFTDRIGKRRAVTMGAALVMPAALALGVVGGHIVLGVAVLFLFVLGFEFAIVSFIPLITEVVPGARAASLGAAAGFGTAGRGLAAVVSTSLYTRIGMGASGLVSAICAGGALTVLTLFVREPATSAGVDLRSSPTP
jgi:predicted MFS family arabinose efflux permease